MIVGLGREHSVVRRAFSELFVSDPNVYMYPEFFDDKRRLLRRDYRGYLKSLFNHSDRVFIALYPDYMYEGWRPLTSLSCVFIYPLHRKEEVDFVLKLDSHLELVLGYASDPRHRDYSLSWFLDVARRYGFKTWYLGLESSNIKYLHAFWGVDVTPMSAPGFKFKDYRRFFTRGYVDFIRYIASL